MAVRRALPTRGWLLVGALSVAVPLIFAEFPVDLHVYLVAGHAVTSGQGLYSPQVQVGALGFTYPPFAALLFALPSLLARNVALVVLCVASAAALTFAIRRALPVAYSRPFVAVCAIGMMWCEPSRITFWLGQINLLLMAVVLYDVLVCSGRRRGMLVGIAAAIKLTPAVFVVFFLARRQYKEAGTAALGFAVAAGLGFLFLPRDSFDYWTDKIFTVSRIGNAARPGNQSLLAMALRFTSTQESAHVLWAATAVGALGMGLYVAVRLSQNSEDLLSAAVVGIVGCLLSPVSWTHHWVWCIPLLGALAARVKDASRAARAAVAAVAMLFLLGGNKEPLKELYRWPLTRILVQNGYVLAALAVIVALTITVSREDESPRGPRYQSGRTR